MSVIVRSIACKVSSNDIIFENSERRKSSNACSMKTSMAQEYIAVKQKHELGLVALSKNVFETIAQIVVEEQDSLVLNDQLNPFKYSINCKIQNDQLILSVDVKVKFDTNVKRACAQLQDKIYENIAHMTDYTPDEIDIRVVGFVF